MYPKIICPYKSMLIFIPPPREAHFLSAVVAYFALHLYTWRYIWAFIPQQRLQIGFILGGCVVLQDARVSEFFLTSPKAVDI